MDVALALPDDGDNIDNLIAMAVQSQASVENLERLLAMRRELKAEYALTQYNKAMAAFQAACPIIRKSKVVLTNDGRVGYRYAPLDAIISQVKGLVQQHGFSYTIDVEEANGQLTSLCIVNHVDGHSKVSRYPVVLSDGTRLMSPTQVTAAALTFAKRYAFCNAFGIMTGDDDNDGRKVDTVDVTPIDIELLDTIQDLLLGNENIVPYILKRYKVDDLAKLTNVQGKDCLNRIESYLGRTSEKGT